MCAVYCLDALFVTDASRLIAGNLTALSAMVHLELPHINVLTKADLVAPGARGAAGRNVRAASCKGAELPSWRVLRRAPPPTAPSPLPCSLARPEARPTSHPARALTLAHPPTHTLAHPPPTLAGALDRYLAPSGEALAGELSRSMGPRFRGLNKAIARVLDDYDMVSFVPCDITDEDSMELVLLHVDHAIAYGEDLEPKEPRDDDEAIERAERMREAAEGRGGEGGEGE